MKKKKHNKKRKKYLFKNIREDLNTDSRFTIIEVIIIILISVSFGIIIGYIITYTSSGFNTLKGDSSVNEIIDVYNSITNNYYKEIDEDELANAAVKGMINYLDDPNTNFLDESSTSKFNESISGNFVGIGVTVQYDGEYNKIIKVNKGGPADKVGLKKDDVIIKVNSKTCKGVSGDELSKLIRGKSGTKVKITVRRNEKEKTFTVVRKKVDIESVSSKIIENDGGKVGYIEISVFSANTYDQFKRNLEKLEDKKIDSLIIDVRNNPGGHLYQAKKILSMFFDKKTVLYQLKNKKNKAKKVYSLSKQSRKYPIVILANGGSASASEVLITCFKDNYKNATFIGEKTYGKGTIQRSKSLNSGTSVKYTIERWVSSKGKDINGKGIEPDYKIELDDEYISNPSFDTDTQIQYGLSILKKSH